MAVQCCLELVDRAASTSAAAQWHLLSAADGLLRIPHGCENDHDASRSKFLGSGNSVGMLFKFPCFLAIVRS